MPRKWQARSDAYVRTYGAPVELDKGENRGRYLRPELFGQPKSMSIHYLPQPTTAELAEDEVWR